jgi:hypothetical protein
MADLPDTGWKNKGGTADRSCKCGSWKQHWLNFSGQPWPEKCSVDGCDKKAEDGGHLYNSLSDSMAEVIVPLCKDCNNPENRAVMALKPGVVKVPANQSETCRP